MSNARITIGDIETKDFRVVAKGYDQQEVDEFLDLICDELERMEDEAAQLQRQVFPSHQHGEEHAKHALQAQQNCALAGWRQALTHALQHQRHRSGKHRQVQQLRPHMRLRQRRARFPD